MAFLVRRNSIAICPFVLAVSVALRHARHLQYIWEDSQTYAQFLLRDFQLRSHSLPNSHVLTAVIVPRALHLRFSLPPSETISSHTMFSQQLQPAPQSGLLLSSGPSSSSSFILIIYAPLPVHLWEHKLKTLPLGNHCGAVKELLQLFPPTFHFYGEIFSNIWFQKNLSIGVTE